MTSDEITLAEIRRWMARLEAKLDNKVVFRDVYESDLRTADIRMKSVEADIEESKDDRKWLRRAVMGQVVAIIGGIVAAAVMAR